MNTRTKPERQMKLSLFLTGDGNYHMAGWRLPSSTSDGGQNIQRWFEAAQTIERGKLHMLFIADAASPPGTDDLETLSLTARIDRMDPIPILSAVSVVTKNLGLAATMTTTYLEPYNLARTMASLDHISGGRAAWNIVTGSNKDDAQQLSRESHAPHSERYERAEEFVDVVRGIWDSYDDDAFPRDKESGVYMRPDKVRLLNHRGKHFSVRGPSAVPRSPQGHPVHDSSRLIGARHEYFGARCRHRVHVAIQPEGRQDVLRQRQESLRSLWPFAGRHAGVAGRAAVHGRNRERGAGKI